VFDQDRYFDVFVEYAKASPEDILIQITIYNRGPEAAEVHVLPTLWFRNQWSWQSQADRPRLRQGAGPPGMGVMQASDPELGERYLACAGDVPLLFTENETNTQRIFGVPNRSPYVKDSINNYIVHGQAEVVNPEQQGTKAAAHYRLTVNPGASQVVRLRLSDVAPAALAQTDGEAAGPFGGQFEATLQPADRKPTRSTPPSFLRCSRRTRPMSCGRSWPACCGANSSTATMWIGGWRNAARTRSSRRARRRRATTAGTTCTTPT
jgi:hypothetical protein